MFGIGHDVPRAIALHLPAVIELLAQRPEAYTADGEFCQQENNMKKLMTICFALSLLTFGMASAQYTKDDNMKADASKKAAQVTGTVSADGKTFVSDKDSKSWTIANPDAVKGHEGHHVTLTAHVDADKNEVHVMSLKMAKKE